MIKPILEKNYELAKIKTALDLGARNGEHSLFLAQKGFKVTAVEVSEELCNQVAKHKNLEVTNGDVMDFKFDKKYGLIFCSCILHFLKDTAYRILEDMQKATESDGINIIIAFLKEGEFENTELGYFEKGELTKIYSGWEIMSYSEKPVGTMMRNKDGSIKKQMCAFLVARKRGVIAAPRTLPKLPDSA